MVATGGYFLTCRPVGRWGPGPASGHRAVHRRSRVRLHHNGSAPPALVQSVRMTSPSSSTSSSPPSSTTAPHRGGAARFAASTLLGVVGPFVVALLLWIVAAPRAELLSVGDGRGLRLPDSGVDGGSQLLVFIVLSGFATVCAVMVLWRRHTHLRRPGGVPALVLLPGVACAIAAAAATPLADVVAAPPDDVPYGEVVRQAPAVGSLFFDRMVFGTSGPSWDWFPPGLDWMVFGVMIAAFTVAVLAYLGDPEAPVSPPPPAAAA